MPRQPSAATFARDPDAWEIADEEWEYLRPYAHDMGENGVEYDDLMAGMDPDTLWPLVHDPKTGETRRALVQRVGRKPARKPKRDSKTKSKAHPKKKATTT
jgi:hypothetical protein